MQANETAVATDDSDVLDGSADVHGLVPRGEEDVPSLDVDDEVRTRAHEASVLRPLRVELPIDSIEFIAHSLI